MSSNETVRSCPAVLCTVWAGVHHLCRHADKLMDPQPLSCAKPFINMEAYSQLSKNNRSFRENEKVVKIFDTKDDSLMPHVKLLRAVGYTLVELQNLTLDERFKALTYPYFDGSHQPTSLKQFSGVVNMLHKTHENGYVHGDVRKCNIVFSDTTSFLLDFDLAKPEETHLIFSHNPFCVQI